ncbi:MAG: TonB-dependent receptor [Kordiimonadaceae bacterium]|nr:TonB-dependent receptor [Kordiimonadaceae bacterium]
MSNLKSTFRRTTLLGSVAMLALGSGLSAVSAQNADIEEIEEVIVTGSRIKRADIESVSPVSVVTSADINLYGNINIEATLNTLPALNPSLTSTTNNGGDGSARLDLRELGTQRTLVLQNGRRIIPFTTGGSVDVNSIPAALVERVEVLTGGASAVYGSDAIGGVVNFVMKNDFEGIEVAGQYNISEKGDADTRTVSMTMGGNFSDGRGNVVVHTSYTDRKGLTQASRDWADEALADFGGGVFTPFGSSNIPGSRVTGLGAGPNGELVLPDGSFATDGLAFDENGLVRDNAGFRFNFAPFQFLQVPQKRFLISALGRYEVTDHIEAYFEASYSSSRVNQQLAPNAGGIPSVGALFVPSTNPLINPVTMQTLLLNFDNGIGGDLVAGDGIASLPSVNRRFTEGGNRQSIREANMQRWVVGARGALSDDWDYDVYYSFSRVNRSDILTNRVSTIKIQQGLNATTDADGNAVCIDQSGGCIPLNIFGIDSVSADAAAFISPTAIRNRTIEQNIVAGSVSGFLESIDFGAGPLGLAFGAEYRSDQAADNPDSLIISGDLGAGNNATPTLGDYDVKEAYGEFVLPLLADQPGAQRLDLEGQFRVADYSTSGGVFSYNVGMQYEPVEGIRFRASYGEAIRAPSILELFGGTASGASTTQDPCAGANVQPDEIAFCQALGVPDPTTYVAPNAQIFTTSGSNPNLFEETATTYTVGVVITPEQVPGLEIIIDYYNINVDDAIQTLTSTTVLDLCVLSRDTSNRFCQAALRNGIGDVEQIFAPNDNIGGLKREGIDWDVSYSFELGEGELTLRNAGNYQIKNADQPTPLSEEVDCRGIFGGSCTGLGNFTSPKWKFNQTVSYSFGDWYVRATGRVISKIINQAFIDDSTAELAQPEIAVNMFLDLAATYQYSESVQFTMGAKNVTNNEPPNYGFFPNVAAQTDPSLYDVLGRSYFAGIKVTY